MYVYHAIYYIYKSRYPAVIVQTCKRFIYFAYSPSNWTPAYNTLNTSQVQ